MKCRCWRTVRRYLDAHHWTSITLRMVAERLHVSEYYLAHVFKQSSACAYTVCDETPDW